MANTATVTKLNPFSIDKGIPLPAKTGASDKYPFKRMEAGDSFSVSEADFSKVRAAISYAQRATGYRFSLRRLPHENRCWRIA